MSRPDHLTPGDAKFLAAVRADSVSKLDGIEALAAELTEAAEAAGVEPDWTDLDRLAEALEDDSPVETEQLDIVRADLRAQIGHIQRGESLDCRRRPGHGPIRLPLGRLVTDRPSGRWIGRGSPASPQRGV